MYQFEGKTALVTGAGSGIGNAAARQLHNAGTKLFLAVHTDRQAVEVAESMPGCVARVLDVRDPIAVRRFVDEAAESGVLDYAVNCVGITGPAQTSVTELEESIWNDVIATDLSGMFYCLKHEIRVMLAQSGLRSIVNMSSGNGLVGVAGLSAYTAAKHGVIGLTKSAALEVATSGIRVNAVAPGYVETPKVLASDEQMLQAFREAHPMKRLAKVDEVADLILFLLSEKSSFATGAVFTLDGGFTAQ